MKIEFNAKSQEIKNLLAIVIERKYLAESELNISKKGKNGEWLRKKICKECHSFKWEEQLVHYDEMYKNQIKYIKSLERTIKILSEHLKKEKEKIKVIDKL